MCKQRIKQLPVLFPGFVCPWGFSDCSPRASWVRQREEEGIPAFIFTVNTLPEPGEISQCKSGLSRNSLKPAPVTSSLGSDCSVSGVLLKMRPKRLLRILYFHKMIPPQVIYCTSRMLSSLRERNLISYFSLTYSWLESLTLLHIMGMQPGLGVENQPPSLSALTTISHSLLCSLPHIGKLQFRSVLCAPSYGSHADEAFVTSHLNWRETQLSRRAQCKAELGVI